MKIAQYQHDHGFAIGMELDGRWIDYTKAYAIYTILELGVAMMPRTTIDQLLLRGEFDEKQFRAESIRFSNSAWR